MSESYENLAGATGKARFFRPKRFAASDLFAAAPPRVWFDDQEFLLDNISSTGAGCRTRDLLPEDIEVEGDGRGVLRLTQFGREIFSARARLARTGLARGVVIVGLALDGANFPLDDLVRKNAHALAHGFAAPVQDRSAVSAEYKSYCADILSFVGGYLNHIDRHLSPIEEKLEPAAVNEIIMRLTEGATSTWRALLEEGNDLVLPVHRNKSKRTVLKQYTERVVTRELTGGQSWGRSYFKPMGYPGDYKIMNFMYDGVPEGDCLHAKFLHMLGVVAGQPIVTRMKALAGLILDHAVAHEGRQEAFNIMSIGSGPARELEPLIKAGGGYKWRATLVDQESAALDYALNKAAGIGAGDALNVSALNISFRDMLSASSFRAQLLEQDIIYSSGLVDYLNPLLAMRFVRRMYDYLKPGGKLIIGNVNDLRTGTLWPMEYILDWTLYFRNEEEMMAMAGETPEAIVSVESDPLSAIYFLVVEKPRVLN
jgi:extracellular factor (EF) 3-hydroxypalmitic acid methyl ester biosynthesis protein